MHYIEKKNGHVYLVTEDSSDGRFKTYYNLGKDPDLIDNEKTKRTKKEED